MVSEYDTSPEGIIPPGTVELMVDEYDGESHGALYQNLCDLAKSHEVLRKKLSSLGTLYPGIKEIDGKTAMFLKQEIGTLGPDSEGRKWTVYSTLPHGSLLLMSKQTDRRFLFTAQDCISLALTAGIEGTDPIPNPSEE